MLFSSSSSFSSHWPSTTASSLSISPKMIPIIFVSLAILSSICAQKHPNVGQTVSSQLSISAQSPPSSSVSSANKPMTTAASLSVPFKTNPNSVPLTLIVAQNASKSNQMATSMVSPHSSNFVKMAQENQSPTNTSRHTNVQEPTSSGVTTMTSSSASDILSPNQTTLSASFAPGTSNKLMASLPYGISLRNVASNMLNINSIASSASASKPTLAAINASGAVTPPTDSKATSSTGLATHTETNYQDANNNKNNVDGINGNNSHQRFHKSHVVINSSSNGNNNDKMKTNPKSVDLPGLDKNRAPAFDKNRHDDDDEDDGRDDYVESLDEDGRENDVSQTSQANQLKVGPILQAQINNKIVPANSNDNFLRLLNMDQHFAAASGKRSASSADLKMAAGGYNYPEATLLSYNNNNHGNKYEHHDDNHDISEDHSASDHYPEQLDSKSSYHSHSNSAGVADDDLGGHHYGKYFQYSSISSPEEWNFGYRRGNPRHIIERRDHGKASSNHWHSKVKWSDEHGSGYGIHVWDFNHGNKK